ncbi:MAG: hypothetical protein JSU65_00920 [Candidatus Zixiibacteriota bacterium]|nr:MAG: hypothetical protein JSU65_00920 [candidate division Zixibacteria bacterium]
MNIFDKMMLIDRRWVFLFLVVVAVTAYVFPHQIPILIEAEVRSIHGFIDTLPKGSIVFVPMDYDPGSMAELHPMTYAIIEQCWRRELKVLVTALSQNGPGMADQALRDIADSLRLDRTYNGEFFEGREIVNGVDYAFLGYKPYPAMVILALGQDFRLPFPLDYYGTPLDSLPMMQGVSNFDDVACAVNISGTNATDYWISYGQARFNFPLAIGVTGVSTAQYYPYYGSGQLFGIMGGMLGAAQYEALADNPGLARSGMPIQLYAHLVIIAFVIMGNIGYFATRRARKRAAGGGRSTMEFTTFLWATFAAFLTLATFSFLYKDNPLYRFAESLVVGATTGYFAIILWHNGLIPKLVYERLDDGHWYYFWLDASRPYYLIPAILGIMIWTRFSKKYSWISRWPLALYIGIGAGAAIPLEMKARVNEQLSAMMREIDWSNFVGHGGFNLIDPFSGLSQLIVFAGAVCALVYFFFSKAHTGALGGMAKFGIWILMIGFGASFGFTVMARISLFINRVQFMDTGWSQAAWDTTNPNYHAGFQIFFWLIVLLVVAYTIFEIVKHVKRPKEADQVESG